ncbi:MAG: DUF4389 domain-containing protein [Xanthomonadales bacterium]|nr:DUF4389 domain-containing protein [Xanthomonadales bacterium]
MTNESEQTNAEHQHHAEANNPWEDWSIWRRILLMVFFGFVFWFCHFIVFAFAIVQAGHRLITGHANQPLQALAEPFGLYIKELVDFLLYNSEKRPFPLADFPSVANTKRTDDDAVSGAGDKSDVENIQPEPATESEIEVAETNTGNEPEGSTTQAPASPTETAAPAKKKVARKKKAAKKKTSRKNTELEDEATSSDDDAKGDNIATSTDP